MRLFPWLVCAVLAVLAVFLKFCVPGYSFSALVCCILIGIIAFYALANQFPAMAVPRRIVTTVLAIGVAVAVVTEGAIIRYSFGSREVDVDYVVVLGAKVWKDGPSPTLWNRIYAAKEHLEAHPGAVAVVSGGKGSDEPVTEASAMYTELVKLGIPPERILLEEKATSTWENLNFSLNLIQETYGTRPEKIGVVSSDYHLFRASLFARKCGVEFAGIPADSTWSQKINHFTREVAGVWHFLILGGQYD